MQIVRKIQTAALLLKDFFSSGERRFSNLEKAMLAQLKNSIPVGWVEAFSDQISNIRLIQRTMEGRSTCYFYKKRKRRLTFPEKSSIRLAKASIDLKNGKFVFEIYIVNGVLFEIMSRKVVPREAWNEIPARCTINLVFEPDDSEFDKALDAEEHSEGC